MIEVLESAERVAEISRSVSIDRDALRRFCRALVSRGLAAPVWEERYHLAGPAEETVAYLLVLDSVNF